MQAACTFQGDIMKLFYLIIKAIILIFFVIIALINFHSVPFTYLPSQTVDLPLIVVMFGMFVVGALFGLFALLARHRRTCRRRHNARNTPIRKPYRYGKYRYLVAAHSRVAAARVFCTGLASGTGGY